MQAVLMQTHRILCSYHVTMHMLIFKYLPNLAISVCSMLNSLPVAVVFYIKDCIFYFIKIFIFPSAFLLYSFTFTVEVCRKLV